MRLFALILLLPIAIILFILFSPILLKIVIGISLLSILVMILTFIFSKGNYSFAKDQNNYLYYICKIGEFSSIIILSIVLANVFFNTISIFSLLKFLYL